MDVKYYKLTELLDLIDQLNQTKCKKLLEDNLDLFTNTPGSTHNHQAWNGGYIDHITEVMNIAVLLYSQLVYTSRSLPFSLSDALLVLFLHDIEKPWKISKINGQYVKNPNLTNKETQTWLFKEKKIAEYNLELTDDHWNGIHYAEGEIYNYSSTNRVQKPLAAFVHMCDVWSARGWFDYPKIKNSW